MESERKYLSESPKALSSLSHPPPTLVTCQFSASALLVCEFKANYCALGWKIGRATSKMMQLSGSFSANPTHWQREMRLEGEDENPFAAGDTRMQTLTRRTLGSYLTRCLYFFLWVRASLGTSCKWRRCPQLTVCHKYTIQNEVCLSSHTYTVAKLTFIWPN